MAFIFKGVNQLVGAAVFIGCICLHGGCATTSEILEVEEGTEMIKKEQYVNQSLKQVVIPSTVKVIGKRAFYVQNSGYWFRNRITSLTLSEGLAEIREYAFAGNELTTLTIPSTVTMIGEGAFSRNPLSSLELNEGLTGIGTGAFAGTSLTSLTIPSSVEVIGKGAFERSGYSKNTPLSSLTLQEGLIEIGENAFAGNGLASLTVPSTVKVIGKGAFKGNPLSKLELPEGLITIEDGAFASCKLSAVNIPESVTGIGKDAFDSIVVLTGNEEFSREITFSTVSVKSWYEEFPSISSRSLTDRLKLVKINSETAMGDSEGPFVFVPDASKDTVFIFDIKNTFKNFPVRYNCLPRHEYTFTCYLTSYNMQVPKTMVAFYLFDRISNKGQFWKYAWENGTEGVVETLVNSQSLTGRYNWNDNFVTDTFSLDERGNYVTSTGKSPSNINPPIL